MTMMASMMAMVMMQWIGTSSAVSACTSQQNTQLAACNSTFTACVNGGVVSMCDCVSNRIECSNGYNCTEADVRGKAWVSECESDGLCSCPTTRVEKLCASIVLTAEATYTNCSAGAIPNATYCDCVTTFNNTVVSNQAACSNSNTDFAVKIAEIALYGSLYCTAEAIQGCTPYEIKGVVQWSEDLSTCSNLYVNGSVTRIGAFCSCLRTIRQKLPPSTSTRTCLLPLDTSLDTFDALYDCDANINTTAICDTDKFDNCAANQTTCMSLSAGSIASACSCYASYSKCVQANIACPGAQLSQASLHLACKATCPITTDCGPEGKTFTLPSTTTLAGPAGSGTSAPGGTDINGSPATGGATGGTNSDGSPATGGTNSDGSPATGGTNSDGSPATGKTDSNGAPVTDKAGAASQIIVAAAALLVAVVALLN
jgi:hypothetical protein